MGASTLPRIICLGKTNRIQVESKMSLSDPSLPVLTEHPERALVRLAIENGTADFMIDTNPLSVALGMRLLRVSMGEASASFTVGEPFLQGNGVVQGGIVSAMLDFAMVFAAFSRIPVEASLASISQTTNFFRPVFSGEVFTEGSLEKVGRSVINARAVLKDKEGVLLASATAPLAVIPFSK